MKERIILEVGVDEFICVSGERIETQSDPNFYPFGHAVTLRLTPESAARIGQEIITVAETEILQDCELPKATEQPAETQTEARTQTKTGQLTFFGDTEAQPALF